MTSPANDTSELTAYALGELQAHQAADIHRLLHQCPAALTELEQVEAVTDALRQHAPICQERLRPEQRHAVLRPAHLPRRVVPMQPRPPARAPQSSLRPVLGGLLKMAAMLAVSGFAYWLGRHADLPAITHAPTLRDEPVEAAPAPRQADSAPAQAMVSATVPAAPVAAAPVDVPEQALPAPERAPVVVIAPSAPEMSAATQAVVSLPAPAAAGPVRPAPSPAQISMLRPNADLAFISAMKKELDEVSIRPADILPAPARVDAKNVFASPARPAADVADRRPPQEIYIHAWRAETASCPWNPATRLLRVTIQMPPSQAAADKTGAYPLQVTFDRRLVREFRRLGTRCTPAAQMDSAGVQTLWYEFLPAGDEAVRNSRALATVTLDKGRFTLPSPGPFNGGARLAVLDRGTAWTAARDDFLYEAALIGFGALLRGDHQSPGLNFQTILALAEKSRANDPTGERARFIRQLNETRRAAGL